MNELPDAVAERLAHMDGAVLLTDAAGKILLFNAEAEALFGYDADNVIGQPVEILLPEAQRAKHARLRDRHRVAPHARPLVSGLELTGRRRDGSQFRAEIELAPVQTDDGLYIASAVREVTGDMSEGALFRSILESAPDAMIIADESGRISIVNGQAEQLFGYRRGELIGEPVEMLLPEEARARHVDHRSAYRKDPVSRRMGAGFTLSARRKDGSTFPAEISLSPVSAKDGFVSTVIRDVTERQQLENELVAARQEAERANKANSAFLAAASHDLRQPVQALALLNGALRRSVSEDPRALSLLESQQQSVRAMASLLNSLLDISRLDAGAIEPEIKAFPVQGLFDQLASEFGRQAQQKRLKFSARPCDAIIRTDPDLLGEIIQNFVSNALRYTTEGSVVLSASVADSQCRIAVTDSGIGIEADQLEHIFEEFKQAGSKRTRNEGFGLGLAIVRRLADLLGHEVNVVSTPGEGSCFSVAVPLADQATMARAADVEPLVSAPVAGSGLIVVIEDDPAVAGALCIVLEAEGFRVLPYSSADELNVGLPSISEVPVVVISDFHVGDGATGDELIARIRLALGESIPAIIISGDTSSIVGDARQVSDCALLSKPVDADQLLAAVSKAVGKQAGQG